MRRTLAPEILDSLPPGDPDALHNRRDLRLTNALLGTHRWIARTVTRLVRAAEPILELGAGTGELGRRLQRAGLHVDGLDLWPTPDGWPCERAWHRGDLRTFAGYARYPVIVANLILHQFGDHELRALGGKLGAHSRVLIAAEPTRRRSSQTLYRALAPLFGANHVSLHDAHVSIAAGFRGGELAARLGFADGWRIQHQDTWLGIHRLVAVRTP